MVQGEHIVYVSSGYYQTVFCILQVTHLTGRGSIKQLCP
jgi:hypothetical protein